MPLHAYESGEGADVQLSVGPQFTQLGEVGPLPRFRLPPAGMPADTAYQVVHDDLLLDGNARLNQLRNPIDHTVFDISELLRIRGWIVPACKMPPKLEDMAMLRIVVRNGFSREMASLLLDDLQRVVARLERKGQPSDAVRTGFHD